MSSFHFKINHSATSDFQTKAKNIKQKGPQELKTAIVKSKNFITGRDRSLSAASNHGDADTEVGNRFHTPSLLQASPPWTEATSREFKGATPSPSPFYFSLFLLLEARY